MMPAQGQSDSDSGLVDYLVHIAKVHRELAVPGDYAVTRRMTLQPEAGELVEADCSPAGEPRLLTPPAARAWLELKAAAAAAGHELQLISAFRSVGYQRGIIQRKRDRGISWDEIFRWSAAPGYSEHHSGRAIDVNAPGCPPLEMAFAATPAFAWLASQAPGLGWRMSYPEDNPHGIAPEPWHWLFTREA